MSERTLYAIVGCHRSGTSATAGALAALGAVDFGTNLMPPSPANPKGYFEDITVVAMHDHLLRQAGCAWDHPPDITEPVCPPGVYREAEEVLGDWLARQEGPIVGVKDPRLTFFPNLWQALARRTGHRFGAIIVRRSPSATAASLAKREGWTMERAAALWVDYARILAYWEALGPHVVTINYEDLLYDPRETLGGLLFDGDWDAVQRFIDPELNHA